MNVPQAMADTSSRQKVRLRKSTSGRHIFTEADEARLMNEIQERKIELKLSLLIITYAYSQDDQTISKKEKKTIMKMLRKDAANFSLKEVEEVHKFLDLHPDIQFVLDYFDENKVNKQIFNKSITKVLESFENNKVYLELVMKLKKAFESHI